MTLPTKMYATIAYIDRSTRWDDISFHVSKRYDSDSMWTYIKHVVEHARSGSVRLLDITVIADDGEEMWNWRS